MKKTNSFVMILFLIGVLSGCASVDYSQKGGFPEAKPDQALVYFYRTPGFVGSTYRFDVFDNNKRIGAMAQNSYFYIFTKAGDHRFYVQDQAIELSANNEPLAKNAPTTNDRAILISLQQGKIYYIKVDIAYELMGGRPVFTQVDKAEAMKLLPSRVYVVPVKNASMNYNVHAEQ
jgi:hypothetical protein